MSNEPVFIAIGIACVVAVLLFIVFIIYCVKKHQDKEETRLRRERRAREERHRRHMMRTQIVRPPPYDPARQNVGPFSHNQIPMTPPPEYKEVATPIPRNRDAVGIGGVAYPPPSYAYPYQNEADQIPTVSRNVAPANTAYNSYNYFITTTAPTNGNSNLNSGNTRDNRRNNNNDNSHSNNSNNNNNTNNNRNNNDDIVQRQNGINNRASDNTLQVHSVSRGVVAPTVSSSGAYTHSRSYDYNSPRNNGLTYSNHMQGRQAPGVASANPSNDRPPTYNTSNATTRANERISFDSINSYNQRLTDTTANHTTHNNERGGPSNTMSYGISGSYTSSSHNAANRQSSQAHDPYSYAINQASLQQGTGSSEGNGRSTNRINDLSLI